MPELLSTYDIDKQHYQTERELFLQEQANFKGGSLPHGIYAIGHLRSMYMILLYNRHKKKNSATSKAFLIKLDDWITDLIKYNKIMANEKDPALYRQSFREKILSFDKIVEEFYDIYEEVKQV